MQSDRPSLEADAIAAAKLANSARVREALRWVLAAVTAIGGWAVAKLDTKFQVDAMSQKMDVLSGEIAVLTSQQRDLVMKIDGMNAAPDPDKDKPAGPLYRLNREVRYAQHTALRAWAAAVTPQKGAKAKRDAGEPLISAFDNLTGMQGKAPGDAADLVISTVAVQ